MRSVVAILIIAFAFTAALAQDEGVSACPAISVAGPAGLFQPGDIIQFSAELSGSIPKGINYSWSISQGEITSGQNTQILEVRTPKASLDVTASLSIGGLPLGCPNTVSETVSVIVEPTASLLDSYRSIPVKEEMARLKRAAVELRRYPGCKLYLIVYQPRSKVDVEKRIESLRNFVKTLGIERNFTIVKGPDNGSESGRIYLLPPGVDELYP